MLRLEGVTVAYGNIVAVHDVTLQAEEGEVLALLGPNGAGKTTTLSAIMGLKAVTAGSISFRGESLVSVRTEDIVRRGLTLTPEGRRVFGALTVAENLRLGGAGRSREGASRWPVDRLYDTFPLLGERREQLAGTLSGGEQQQLAIARSLMSDPDMLLLDEPSLGLAPQIVDVIFELVTHLAETGLTVVLVEQNAMRSLEIADRAVVLASGRKVFDGSAQELRHSDELLSAYLALDAPAEPLGGAS